MNRRTNRSNNSISIFSLYPLPNITIAHCARARTSQAWGGFIAPLEVLVLHSGDEYREVVTLLCAVVERVEAIEHFGRR